MIPFADIGDTLLAGFFYVLFALELGGPFIIGVIFPIYLIMQWRKHNPKYWKRGRDWYIWLYVLFLVGGILFFGYLAFIFYAFSHLDR